MESKSFPRCPPSGTKRRGGLGPPRHERSPGPATLGRRPASPRLRCPSPRPQQIGRTLPAHSLPGSEGDLLRRSSGGDDPHRWALARRPRIARRRTCARNPWTSLPAVPLPAQGDGAAAADLEGQLAEVVRAVDATDGLVPAVGHSAYATIAWMAAGARPDRIARVEMIGGFPSGDQGIFFDSLPVEGEWAEFEGPVAADLSPARRAVIEAGVVPVPAAVVRATVRLRDQRHFEVPVAVRCPEFSAAQSRAWVDGAGSPHPDRGAPLFSAPTAKFPQGATRLPGNPLRQGRAAAVPASLRQSRMATGRPWWGVAWASQ